MIHSLHICLVETQNMIAEFLAHKKPKNVNEFIKKHNTTILTQELCEDEFLSLRIQDISQCSCDLNSVTKQSSPKSMNIMMGIHVVMQLKLNLFPSFRGVDK